MVSTSEPAYVPLPSAESTDELSHSPKPPATSRWSSTATRRPVLICLAFVFLAYASYRVGEWKGRQQAALGDHLQSPAESDDLSALPTASKDTDEDLAAPSTVPTANPNNTDGEMSTGKYSVG